MVIVRCIIIIMMKANSCNLRLKLDLFFHDILDCITIIDFYESKELN